MVQPRPSRVSTPPQTRGPAWRRYRSLIALLMFAAVFIGESVYSYTRKSATMDEPVHLADGYFSLARADYRFDPEHPPLLRMFAALPLLFQSVKADTSVIDTTTSDTWAIVELANDAHRFLYIQNDADRLLYPARFMIVLLGVLLGVLLFAWVHEWLGFVPACAALAMLALEPNIVAHFSTVSTDAGLTTFAFGALYYLWRVCRQWTPLNIAGLCLFCALSLATKYTAVLLYPILMALLALSVYPFSRLSLKRAATIMALVLITSYAALWATYRFSYAPSRNSNWFYELHKNPYLVERVPTLARAVAWVDDHHLLPNVFTEGFFIGQAKAQQRRAYLMGNYSETGWWYFFPVSILIKSPIPLLTLTAFGLWVLIRGGPVQEPRSFALMFLAMPMLGFLLPPMVSHLNIGLRHVLTIYPFLIMLAAFAVARLLAVEALAGKGVLVAAAVVWLFEFGRVYPSPLAFFNTFVGGPANGARYLVDSNLDWGQDLKGLKVWMTERSIPEISLAYFGAADPVYYGIKARYLNGAMPYVRNDELRPPQIPGYVAVSETLASGALAPPEGRDAYAGLRSLTPVAVIGYSIKVYWVDKPWWK